MQGISRSKDIWTPDTHHLSCVLLLHQRRQVELCGLFPCKTTISPKGYLKAGSFSSHFSLSFFWLPPFVSPPPLCSTLSILFPSIRSKYIGGLQSHHISSLIENTWMSSRKPSMLHFITCEKHHYKNHTWYLVEEKLAFDFPNRRVSKFTALNTHGMLIVTTDNLIVQKKVWHKVQIDFMSLWLNPQSKFD